MAIKALILMLVCVAGCKKDHNENFPVSSNEDLSYLIITYSREDRSDQNLCENVNIYNRYKTLSHKLYWNGQLSHEGLNYEYDGLNCNYDVFSYNLNSLNGDEVYLHQHFKNEYLDETYLRQKHTIEYIYRTNSGQEDQVYESFYEYDGKKVVGFKHFVNGILEIEADGFSYDGLNCSYTSRYYLDTGDITNILKIEIQYLDDTYLRPTDTRYTTDDNEVYYKSVKYEGKKQKGYKVFVNGTLSEEGRDYVYDGLKCYYKVDYYQNGELSSTSSFEVHYLE